jgi:hypothetical protein
MCYLIIIPECVTYTVYSLVILKWGELIRMGESIRLNYETNSETVVEDYEANELILY